LGNPWKSMTLLDWHDRCAHVGDRESDIYELFSAAKGAGTHFQSCTCVDRLADDGSHTIARRWPRRAVTDCSGWKCSIGTVPPRKPFLN